MWLCQTEEHKLILRIKKDKIVTLKTARHSFCLNISYFWNTIYLLGSHVPKERKRKKKEKCVAVLFLLRNQQLLRRGYFLVKIPSFKILPGQFPPRKKMCLQVPRLGSLARFHLHLHHWQIVGKISQPLTIKVTSEDHMRRAI